MSNTDFDVLFDLYLDACLVTAANGRIEAANSAARSLLLSSTDAPSETGDGSGDINQLLGQSLGDFVVPSERIEFQQRLNALQQPEVTVPVWEIALQDDRDRSFLAKLHARGFCDRDGRLKIYWCIQDISRREAAIHELRQVNRTLDEEVQQRTQALLEANHALQEKIQALEQAQAAFKLQTKQERLIDTIMRRLYQADSLDEILDTTVTEVRQFLKADRVIIYRFKPDWSGTVTVESVAPGMMPILYTTIDEPCFRSQYVPLYQQGRVRAIEDIYTENIDPCHQELLASFQVRSNLVVPILQDGDLWGLLIAHHCQSPRHWTQVEIELLSKLAMQAGIAIRQATLYEQWHRLATLDGLTEVANRRRFDTYLEDLWQQHHQDGVPLTLILSDIDFFKDYNDTYGHPAGDECLKQVARAMSSTFGRSDDLVARYGGEEFAIVLSNTELEEALGLIVALRNAIKNLNLEHQASPFDRVTLSFGIASTAPEAGKSPGELIDMADRALYRAKAKGRNRIAIPSATELLP